MEVWFYHLQRQPLMEVLPVLAGKALERGWRVAVQTSEARLKALDDELWTWRDESFLPHGLADDPRAGRQPIVVTAETGNPNGAAMRMVVDGAAFAPDDGVYERVILLFDGRSEAEVAAARIQWTRLKAAGLVLAYWQQDEAGRWQQRMQSRPTA